MEVDDIIQTIEQFNADEIVGTRYSRATLNSSPTNVVESSRQPACALARRKGRPHVLRHHDNQRCELLQPMLATHRLPRGESPRGATTPPLIERFLYDGHDRIQKQDVHRQPGKRRRPEIIDGLSGTVILAQISFFFLYMLV